MIVSACGEVSGEENGSRHQRVIVIIICHQEKNGAKSDESS
jgi:hypothetical protein